MTALSGQMGTYWRAPSLRPSTLLSVFLVEGLDLLTHCRPLLLAVCLDVGHAVW